MFRPMLAPGQSPSNCPEYFKLLRYPLFVSPKLDGIRCLTIHQNCISRSGKLLPSSQAREMFAKYPNLDGELIVGDPEDYHVYNRTNSHVMSYNKPADDLRFYVFDFIHPDYLHEPYVTRYEMAEEFIKKQNDPQLRLLPQILVENERQLLHFEAECLKTGYEGIMLRDPIGPYKNGRGTFKEGIIYKLKREEDSEAVLVDLEEQMRNDNPLEKSELGFAKRSQAAEGLTPAGTLGKFIVMWEGDVLPVSPGKFTHQERQEIWNNPDKYIGQILKFRHFPHGVKDRPRFPRAIGFRDERDLS